MTEYSLNLNRNHGTPADQGRWNLRIIEGMTAEEIGDWVLKQIRRDRPRYLPSTAPETEAAQEVYRNLRDASGLPRPVIGSRMGPKKCHGCEDGGIRHADDCEDC